jgi:hypothetical protein
MGLGGVFFEEVNSGYGWGCLLRMSTMGMGRVFI